jgi:MoaA/NifB/PqqE/SkfB family radical SAM enzyme
MFGLKDKFKIFTIDRNQSKKSFSDFFSRYNNSRITKNKVALCHAPFNSMYFNVHGEVGPCWLTLDNKDKYPDKSIRDIWFGDKFSKLREELKTTMGHQCITCRKNIESGNYISVLSKLYDHSYEIGSYPSMMEFELSNRCNLECIMCKGDLSSTIRKLRDELPELSIPYDDKFVEQLEEFIPHLEEAKFLGGEPFLIDIYYKIWQVIEKLNPSIKITVTTNGTAFTKKIEDLLNSLHFSIIISIDSFNKITYNKIRLRGDFEKVMENFEKFREYTHKKKSYFGVSINPLRENWHEIHDYVNFCNQKNASVWFNTVVYPHETALWSMPAEKLEEAYLFLSSKPLAPKNTETSSLVYENNCQKYYNLVNVQLHNWCQEAIARKKEKEIFLNNNNIEQVYQKLKSNINYYISSDVYIAEHLKKIKIKQVDSILQKLMNDNEIQEIKRLFLLTESELIRDFQS